ncbi:hypothetical protein DSM110093_01362 [Sulfitobacter sp. DSM 110093]|uniref:DUF2254 domain-containing protein n=1 Tax=Sulfitobacter sp. DSM 110093 TaxID=2883127 RepID=UPI001FAE118F|nr:DUF2254 domain-containing protein [Sulfitobacter sp. DSM 110093]UOA31592.1 hypothetical protein DSM110093_01362 [Sulfitobacter sp. DSM 110093]
MNIKDLIPHTLFRKAREYSRKLWVRVVFMGLLAFVALGMTQLFEPLVPKEVATRLTGDAADRLLQIIADAMLAVTIFSITIMVTVYRSTSAQFTPRAHRLIIQDRTTQNTLAVFIGAYVYALVAIIMRELGVYVDERSFVLFLTTVMVLAIIVVFLIRWVLHLQSFGSLIDTTRQIESVTTSLFKERLKTPCMGGHPLTGPAPEDARPIFARESGYLKHIYPEALDQQARDHGVEVYLTRRIGDFVFVGEPLVRAARRGTPQDAEHDWESLEEKVTSTVQLGDLRTFDQDPRFGLRVLGEVASKALSPGINDGGTAIDVITRIGRILSYYSDEAEPTEEIELPNLHIAPIAAEALIEDGFGALARDGASVVEVQMALQQVLAGLMHHPDAGLAAAAREAAENHLRRAFEEVPFGPDRARIWSAAQEDVRAAVQSPE